MPLRRKQNHPTHAVPTAAELKCYRLARSELATTSVCARRRAVRWERRGANEGPTRPATAEPSARGVNFNPP